MGVGLPTQKIAKLNDAKIACAPTTTNKDILTFKACDFLKDRKIQNLIIFTLPEQSQCVL